MKVQNFVLGDRRLTLLVHAVVQPPAHAWLRGRVCMGRKAQTIVPTVFVERAKDSTVKRQRSGRRKRHSSVRGFETLKNLWTLLRCFVLT